jgi:hypothetical protein
LLWYLQGGTEIFFKNTLCLQAFKNVEARASVTTTTEETSVFVNFNEVPVFVQVLDGCGVGGGGVV